MKAIVLAGGYATRMWPITMNRPKMLLPLGDRTVIGHLFEELEADDRIDEIYVSTNRQFASEFERFIAMSEFSRPRLSVEDTASESEKLGVVGALAQLVDREGIDDDLLVVAGDNLVSFAMSDFIDTFEERDAPTIATYDVGSLEKAKSYGVVEVDEGRVVGFQEKPEEPTSTLVSIACYSFPKEALAFEEYLAEGNNPDEIGWFVQWLQDRQSVYVYAFDEAWFDIGSAESYLDAVSWTLDGDSIVAESAMVEESDLKENVHVMPGATVQDSTLCNSVVFPHATITDSDIDRSVIDEHALISGTDLDDALVGPHTKVRSQSGDESEK
jgi:glucose-1-phosphate thymidylyltransferase